MNPAPAATAAVILNPYAGRWLARRKRPEAEAALTAAGVRFQVFETERPHHGEELAAQAVRAGFSPIIAAGGDGSISEVVNGMMAQADETGAPPPPLGVLPLGSANDLVDNLRLPRELPAAAAVIAAGQVYPLDLGWVNGRYFDNNSAIGLEPYITLIERRITRLHGALRYLVATLRGVAAHPRWRMRLEWDGGSVEGLQNLVTIGNCPRTGGIFYVTPHADPTDGLLTFVYGHLPTRLAVLRALPMLLRPAAGNYVEHPAIHEVHTRWLKITCASAAPFHADGEIQPGDIRTLDYRVVPARLSILLPAAPNPT